eukprot:7781687-Pyramimonas_sp.AAC.1
MRAVVVPTKSPPWPSNRQNIPVRTCGTERQFRDRGEDLEHCYKRSPTSMAGIDVGLLGKDGRKAVGRVCARILRSWVGTARLATTARTTSSFHTPEKGRQDKHHVPPRENCNLYAIATELQYGFSIAQVVGGGLPGVGM